MILGFLISLYLESTSLGHALEMFESLVGSDIHVEGFNNYVRIDILESLFGSFHLRKANLLWSEE